MASLPVRIGALVPLTPPGWAAAGRQLLAGLELATADVNDAGGVHGRPLELEIRDTAADPARAVAAVEQLAASDAVALVGEYHSVVAREAAIAADAHGLPFLCSSAVLDALVDRSTDLIARVAPAQSHGWRIYADHLATTGHRRVAVVRQPSLYWSTGAGILRDRLGSHGCSLVEIDLTEVGPEQVPDVLEREGADAVLLLVGHPQPAAALVRAVRHDPRTSGLLVGAPAGQPELDDWAALGADGAAVPFLRYLPDRLGALGSRVEAALRERLGREPSFVAFEGYDCVLVLAEVLRRHGAERATAPRWWSGVDVEGTRGRIAFSRVPGIGVWQWAWPPVQVVDRDPADPDRFRVLAGD